MWHFLVNKQCLISCSCISMSLNDHVVNSNLIYMCKRMWEGSRFRGVSLLYPRKFENAAMPRQRWSKSLFWTYLDLFNKQTIDFFLSYICSSPRKKVFNQRAGLSFPHFLLEYFSISQCKIWYSPLNYCICKNLCCSNRIHMKPTIYLFPRTYYNLSMHVDA